MVHGDSRAPRRKRPAKLVLFALTMAVLVTTSGCSLLSGSNSARSDGPAGSTLEKPSIKVGANATINRSALQLAIDRGYFQQEGLEVQVDATDNSTAGVNKVLGGQLDLNLGAYVPFINAKATGSPMKIVAESYVSGPNTTALMTRPNSPIRSLRDVPGKKIAVSDVNSLTDLPLKSVLKTNGLDFNNVQWVRVPFPQMINAVQTGNVDAAVMVEPFITQSAQQGAVNITDVFTGPTADFPQAGFAATEKFVQDNPKTVAAFQRALIRGQRDASDRNALEPVLIKDIKIDQSTAPLVNLGLFPTTLEPNRLQRVADLMLEFGVINQPVNVRDMIQPLATN
jgi:NitT/TauT family transport system substrate-binding protein